MGARYEALRGYLGQVHNLQRTAMVLSWDPCIRYLRAKFGDIYGDLAVPGKPPAVWATA